MLKQVSNPDVTLSYVTVWSLNWRAAMSTSGTTQAFPPMLTCNKENRPMVERNRKGWSKLKACVVHCQSVVLLTSLMCLWIGLFSFHWDCWRPSPTTMPQCRNRLTIWDTRWPTQVRSHKCFLWTYFHCAWDCHELSNWILTQTLKGTLTSFPFKDRETGGIWLARTWTPALFQHLFFHSLESLTSSGPRWQHYSANTTWRRSLLLLFKVGPAFDFSLGFPSVKEDTLSPSVIGKLTWMSYLASWLWLPPCHTIADS